jgi:hypothetical protein
MGRWLLLGLAGCAGSSGDGGETGATDTDDTEIPDLPPLVEIGSGVDEFLPLEDGGEILIVQGPQGGHHFDGSLRAQGIPPGDGRDLTNPDNPTTTFRIVRVSDGQQLDVGITFTQGLETTDEPGVYAVLGRKVIFDRNWVQFDDDVTGVECDFIVEIQAVDGTVLTDTRRVIGVPHPLNAF